jgi:hypothetical protein
MTVNQQIEELLQEASGLGIRKEVMDASEKYIDQGMDELDALEAAFAELTDIDDEYSDESYVSDLLDWPDLGDEWEDYDDSASDYFDEDED